LRCRGLKRVPSVVTGVVAFPTVAMLWAWRAPALCRPVAIACLVFGVLHLVYHADHLYGFSTRLMSWVCWTGPGPVSTSCSNRS